MTFVSATTFVPKSRVRGSCDPNAIEWTEHRIHLMQAKWGIKAIWDDVTPSNVRRFRFPLVITEVDAGSEAEDQGVKPGDHVVAAGHTGSPNGILRVQAQACMGKLYVEDAIAAILLRGGPCHLTVQRPERVHSCPECGSQELEHDARAGDLVCTKCGLVVRERTMTAQWAARPSDNAPTLEEAPPAAMATVVPAPPTASAAAAGTPAARLSAAQRRAAGGTAAGEARAEAVRREVEGLCERMGLPSAMARDAVDLCARAAAAAAAAAAGGKARAGAGLRRAAAAACAAVMLVCDTRRVPRTLKEMAAAAGGTASARQIVAARKAVQRLLRLCPPPAAPAALVTRFCANLAPPPAVERRAADLAARAAGGLAGCAPASIAAGAIFAACEELARARPGPVAGAGRLPTAREVSAATGAAETTVVRMGRRLAEAARRGTA